MVQTISGPAAPIVTTHDPNGFRNFMTALESGRRAATERKQQSALDRLASVVGAQSDATGLDRAAAGVNPLAALQTLTQRRQATQEEKYAFGERLGTTAAEILQLPEDQRRPVWASVVPKVIEEAKRLGLEHTPDDTYDENELRAVAVRFGKMPKPDGSKGFTLSAGARRYDASGKLIAEAPPRETDSGMWNRVSPEETQQLGFAPGTILQRNTRTNQLRPLQRPAQGQVLQDAQGNVTRGAQRDIRIHAAQAFGGVLNPVTGQIEGLNPELAEQALTLSARATELVQAGEETNIAAAVRRALQEMQRGGTGSPPAPEAAPAAPATPSAANAPQAAPTGRQRATNPQTGEVVEFNPDSGQWEPVQ